ncbi:MAG: YDG domain-containing protein, partial [Candidatus Ancillula sp.]|nr:YDG domain-containing protein [Candidatus Ancillula sp.]
LPGDLFTVDTHAGAQTYTVDATSGSLSASITGGNTLTLSGGSGTATIGLTTATTDNYLAGAQTTAVLTVNPLTLDITTTADNKEYDGTTTATVHFTYNNTVGSDVVSIEGGSYSANFVNADAGDNKKVTVTNAALEGGDKDFYALPSPIEAYANILQQQEQTPEFTVDYETEKLTLPNTVDSASYTVKYSDGKREFTEEFPNTKSIAIDPAWLSKTISIVKTARDTNYLDSEIESIPLPARSAAPVEGKSTFQVTGKPEFADEYQTLTIQPGYEYYRVSNTVDDTTECSIAADGYEKVVTNATVLTGAENIGTYCIQKVAVVAEDAFHSFAAKTSVAPGPKPVTTPVEVSITPSEIRGAWVDENGVVHAKQNSTITIILHERLHDGEIVEAKLDDYKLTSSVDSDIIHQNTVTFPHASPHVITASLISNPNITKQVLIEVEPTAGGSSANGSTTAITGVETGALVATLLMLMLGAGFVRTRKKMK